MWQDWLNGLAGLWLIVSVLGNYATRSNLIVTGIVIIILSVWELIQYQGREARLSHR